MLVIQMISQIYRMSQAGATTGSGIRISELEKSFVGAGLV